MQKSKTERKLLKNASKFAALEAELQLIFPIKVFALIEELAKTYLEREKFDDIARNRVGKLAFVLRQETFAKFGHESLETIALAKLLRSTPGGWVPPGPVLDSISHMRTYPRHHRLDANQEAAAEMIMQVWQAFGRFRSIGGRGMEGGRGGGQVLHPLDVMGDDLWEHYCKVYKPWYKKAASISVNRRRYSEGSISLAAVTFKILVEDYHPEAVDKAYSLVQGQAFRSLGAALTGYYEPEVLDAFLLRPPAGDVVDAHPASKAAKPR